jgi:hypothetical protein
MRKALALTLLLGSAITLVAMKAPQQGQTLRLNLKPGQVWTYKLAVERPNKARSGEMVNRFKVTKVDNNVIILQGNVVGLRQGGKDKTKELNILMGPRPATIPYDHLSRRVGQLIPLENREADPKVRAKLGEEEYINVALLIGEAGLYHGHFKQEPVKPGDSWIGSVTATGGCTSATFTYKGSKGNIAHFEVTDIAMDRHDQIGPMKLQIDVNSGMPVYMEYRVKQRQSGLESKFVQTLVSGPAKA